MDASAVIKCDFKKICRLCLSQDGPLTSLYPRGGDEAPLYLIAQTCAAVDIIENDGLPPNICCACRDTILSSYQFRQQVSRNDTILRRIAGMKPDPEEEGPNEEADLTAMMEENFWPAENTAGETVGSSKVQDSDVKSNYVQTINETPDKTEEVLESTGFHFLAEEDRAAIGDENISSSSNDQWSNPRSVNTTDIDREEINKLISNQKYSLTEYGTPAADGSGYCFECEKIFCRFSDHVQLKHFTDAFWCDQCDVLCKSPDSLDRHMRRVHLKEEGSSNFVCADRSAISTADKKIVRKPTDNPEILVRAKMFEYGIRNPDGSYFCKPCNKFYKKNVFQSHVKLFHLRIRDFMCEQCGFRTISKTFLIQHIDGIHLKVRKYKCLTCPLRFFTKCRLNDHMRSHRPGGVRKFICEVCGKSCRSPRCLKIHLRAQHFPELKIKCDFCDCRYASGTTLKKHLRESH